MGRHSAPDDDEEPAGTVVVEASPANGAVDGTASGTGDDAGADRRGRHSRGEDVQDTGPVPGAALRRAEERAAVQDERPTQRLDLAAIEAAGATLEAPAQTDEEPPPPPAPRGAQSTAADLALIRRHPEVRNRVLGAALVPFVLYAVVLLVLSATGVQYLLWIWIPTVVAGVLIGFVLDAAHKRYAAGPAATEPPPG